MAEYIKKITARTVGCEKKVGASFVVYGRVMRATTSESQFGPYTKFGGQFGALNEDTGQEYGSAAFLPPGIMEDEILSALQSAQENDQRAVVDLAIRFKTKADAKSAIGYVWTAEFLQKPSIDDPTSRLREAIQAKLQLPKPKDAA